MFRIKGFTLIELLIVVAIIAILAAIAVPNFLEAQVRAKVSRCKNDLRAMATALESYKIDENQYPPDLQFYQGWSGRGNLNDRFANCVLGRLTTPVAYMSSLPDNVYPLKTNAQNDQRRYLYNSDNVWRKVITGELSNFQPNAALFNSSGQMDAEMNCLWSLQSNGPDQVSNVGSYLMFGQHVLNRIAAYPPWGIYQGCLYDPTNGTISAGDIVRVGP